MALRLGHPLTLLAKLKGQFALYNPMKLQLVIIVNNMKLTTSCDMIFL